MNFPPNMPPSYGELKRTFEPTFGLRKKPRLSFGPQQTGPECPYMPPAIRPMSLARQQAPNQQTPVLNHQYIQNPASNQYVQQNSAANHYVQQNPPSNQYGQQNPPSNQYVQQNLAQNHYVQQNPASNQYVQQHPASNQRVQQNSASNQYVQQKPASNQYIQQKQASNHYVPNPTQNQNQYAQQTPAPNHYAPARPTPTPSHRFVQPSATAASIPVPSQSIPLRQQNGGSQQFYQPRPRQFNSVPVFPSPVQVSRPSPPRFASPSPRAAREVPRFLVGSVEKVLQWSKVAKGQPVMFEVFGVLDYVRNEGPVEKIFNLRDPNGGNVLQVVFVEIDRPLAEFPPGSVVKVRGAMKGRSRLQAFSVVSSSLEELSAAQHVIFICDRAAHDLAHAA